VIVVSPKVNMCSSYILTRTCAPVIYWREHVLQLYIDENMCSSYILTRTCAPVIYWREQIKLWWNEGGICFILGQHIWICIHSASYWKVSLRLSFEHLSPLGRIDSEPTSLCSYSLMLHAQRRINKYQLFNLCNWLTENWQKRVVLPI
jgi:hypothetical protein